MKIVVWAPEFNFACGGCIVLHKLAYILRSLGIDAYLSPEKEIHNNYYNTPLFSGDIGDAIAIYPEVVSGNPLNAKQVVRWILYFPGWHMGNSFVPDPSDILVTYSFLFSKDFPEAELLLVRELWLDIFHNNEPQQRSGTCFTRRKGKDKPIIPQTIGQTEITDCSDLHVLARLFRSKELFYSYDSYTYLSLHAALCGCTSIVIPDGNVSKEEWKKGNPAFRYGIAYGLDDIDWVQQTRPLILDHLKSLEDESIVLVKRLLERIKQNEKS